VVNEAINGSERHSLIGKNLVPLSKRLIGGNQDRAMFVSAADQLEQNRGLGLILGDVGDIIEDEQVVAIELGDGGFEGQFLARDLQSLDEIGGAGEQDTIPGFDQRAADSCREMAFADAWRAEYETIVAGFDSGVTGCEGGDMSFADNGHGIEVETIERFADRQAGVEQMPFDAAPLPIGEFMLGQSGQEASCRPAFLVRLCGNIGPEMFDGRQAEFGEQKGKSSGVSCAIGVHATSPRLMVPSSL